MANQYNNFSILGISLQGIENFIEKIEKDEKLSLQDKTIEEVQTFILSLTNDTSTSFCENFHHQKTFDIQQANVFVSYAWKYKFFNVVNTLKEYCRLHNNSGTIYFWFDLFSISQHKTATQRNMGTKSWAEGFKQSIENIGHTLLILEWNNPIPFTRMWCIWELACSTRNKIPLDVAMNKNEEQIFMNDLQSNYSEIEKKYLVSI